MYACVYIHTRAVVVVSRAKKEPASRRDRGTERESRGSDRGVREEDRERE